MSEKNLKSKAKSSNDASAGLVYCLGFIGALIYFVKAADSFWDVILGILQSIVWPAYVIYKLLESFYGVV